MHFNLHESQLCSLTHLNIFHTMQPVQQSVAHTGLQSRVSGVQQHIRPPHTVVPPWVQPGQLRQRGPRLRQQSGAIHPLPGVLSLPRPPCALLALVQGVQGIRIADVGVRVLALVVSKRLVRWRKVRRLEVRRGRMRQRWRAGVGTRMRYRAQLGQARAVARDTVMPVLEEGAEKNRTN